MPAIDLPTLKQHVAYRRLAEVYLFVGEDLKLVDRMVDAIESTGINPAEVSPHHWRHVHNRLTAGQEPRSYTVEQHRAILLRRRVEP